MLGPFTDIRKLEMYETKSGRYQAYFQLTRPNGEHEFITSEQFEEAKSTFLKEKRRKERRQAKIDAINERAEMAMQNGMAFGTQGYNDIMGG